MTFEEFYNIPKNKKMVEVLTSKAYYSNRGYYIKKHMEYEEFLNEVILRLIKHWNYFQTTYKSSSNTFIDNVVFRTVSKLYEEMDRQKRKLNYDDNIIRIDTPTEHDENGKEIDTKEIKADDYNSFNENTLINLIANKIDNMTDKKICVLYLNGITQKRIVEITGLTKRQVEHRINTKYRPLFIETYREYKNNLVI